MATSTLYKMRTVALREMNGGHDESYAWLPKYYEVVRSTNPGSIANWCRSLVGVDGAHLKGNFGGVLLSVVAIDANNELFPFAWAIVNAEDEESWRFFVWHLKRVLQSCKRGDGDEWCIISDRQKGIDAAVTALWPTTGRRYCCKHLAKNWKGAFPGPLMYALFWKACSATSPFTFKKAMEQIQRTNPLALVWLSKIGDQARWSRHQFDPNICSEENKTNFVESFNATLGVDRARPVLTLRVCMVRMSKRRQACANWNDNEPCPNIVRRIQKFVLDSRMCKAYESGPGEFEIRDGKSMLPVSLNKRTCICGLWQISGLPCKHAIRALLYAKEDPYMYTSTWYYGGVYKQTYGQTIKSIPDQDNWPEIDQPKILPPTLRRGVDRPPRNRRREIGEEEKGKRSTTIRCTNCHEFGHNRLTCKG
ncbi:uncharacterized protein LOC104903146 [Beta vulgaris subsp. vulgaris]|uniref:uncharacterized protein LOC104903146 n=1 Tax=Beta vulgaris subsp. vulgaris TaxID=3555 RepID=UPI0005401603|nr:uncharacterized protein LOC104903146 [Beta vulgaris subsp. vulgaris]